ncbi:MAG TPA: hypothetical protein VFS08_11680 [Gemmatimonadaceae bacterium]|nr:hypothetical protein [Gemmatimonadaceae bacterium]
MHRRLLCLGVALLAACATTDTAADTSAAADTAGSATATADPDVAAPGGAIPAGYVGQVDPPRPGRPPTDIADASYTVSDGRWEVRTGPAHIVYAPGDTASGSYSATAAFELLEEPVHADAVGLFIGGTDLGQPSQRYTYFLVRHTGEYMIRVRESSDSLRMIAEWTPSPDVPKLGPDGRASYELTAHVDADSTRFLVNDRVVATVATASIPTDGIAGLRINHNLHVRTGPVTIER